MTTADTTTPETTTPETPRPVREVVTSTRTLEGGGFAVRRPFPTPGRSLVDPFLLLDHMGPADYAPGEAKGAPDHPHRGFETVTYMLEGEMEHEDSAGNRDVIRPGDVQWMTAGAGVVHSEMPSERIQREGGRVEGLQLWVNLSKADKAVPAAYQPITSDRIPSVDLPGGGTARVIAGSALGAQGPASTHEPILYVHLSLPQGVTADVPVPVGHNAFTYVVRGAATIGSGDGAHRTTEGQMALLGPNGTSARVTGADEGGPTEVLVLAGKPIGEPVARYGPFVMNTRDELVTAFEDYEAGRLGTITR